MHGMLVYYMYYYYYTKHYILLLTATFTRELCSWTHFILQRS